MEKRITVMEFLLKLINSIFTQFGLAIGSHGLFCLMKWKQDWSYHHNKYEIALTKALLGIDASKSWLSTNLPVAWFVYLLLVVGASLIVISCFGFVGAGTRNSCCLCFYSVLLVELFVAQLGAAAFVFFNHNWKEIIIFHYSLCCFLFILYIYMPSDRSSNFNSTYHFITMNWKIMRWVFLGPLASQVIALVLALYLRPLNRVIYDHHDDVRVVYPNIVRPTTTAVEESSKPPGASSSNQS
ncbi:hypothetical protein GH714_003897 [Hevea brasiliensis]|uniref:Uncharacterized protein n=1 Tax=Hevea brasiliensis TaxID=3981 RepID=A0A6A6KZY4_HEVBR|nr:hypothetical protein GH714_003897 [Hevea brasiliensis]